MSETALRVMRQPDQDPTRIHVGTAVFGGPEPVVIAGPCAVESEEQIHAAATSVRAAGAQLLRGGAYKPRTSPYSFRGLGEDGLRMLAAAGDATDLPIVTEVLTVADVPLVATYADVLQIGARNMQHYALLEAVGQQPRPVLLKRGLAATVDEWLLAAEYILAQGNPNVILCERGIRTFESSTRFTLDLGGMLVAQRRTHLPIIVDPSHAAGDRAYVVPLALAALAAGAAGLIVEVHPDPDAATSDREQAIHPETFASLMRAVRPLPTVTASVRGAISVTENTRVAIADATRILLRALLRENDLPSSAVFRAVFTLTPDLDADFPARTARHRGLAHAALISAQEIPVPLAPPRMLRILLDVRMPTLRPLRPVYLRDAAHLTDQIDRSFAPVLTASGSV